MVLLRTNKFRGAFKLIDDLRQFLAKQLPNEDRITPLIEWFFINAVQDQYELANNIPSEWVSKIVEKATGRKVGKVVFVSNSAPIQKPEWMSEEVYRDSKNWWYVHEFLYTLAESIGVDLLDTLSIRHARDLYEPHMRIEVALREDVGDIRWQKFCEISNELESLAWFGFCESVGSYDKAFRIVWYTGFKGFLGLLLAGKKKEADRLEPLSVLIHDCIPLGWKKDEPEALIVLVP